MKEHFATHKHALALKELGFDEPCFRFQNNISNIIEEKGWLNWNEVEQFVSVPLKQQVFRWFREHHGLYSAVIPKKADPDNHVTGIEWYVKICGEDGIEIGLAGAYTYEEAETACIDKLIKIVKGGKK